MAIHLLENRNEYRLGVWKIEESEERLLRLSNTLLPQAQNPTRRLEQLAVRALAVAMGVPKATIEHQTSGKPYLKDSDLHISISHTKDYAAIMLSINPNIGIDIEKISARALKIRKKFMHPDEEAALSTLKLNETKESTAILLHWCAKESLFKSIEEEGIDFSNELRIQDFKFNANSGTFRGESARTKSQFQIDYNVYPEFVITCCFSTVSK